MPLQQSEICLTLGPKPGLSAAVGARDLSLRLHRDLSLPGPAQPGGRCFLPTVTDWDVTDTYFYAGWPVQGDQALIERQERSTGATVRLAIPQSAYAASWADRQTLAFV